MTADHDPALPPPARKQPQGGTSPAAAGAPSPPSTHSDHFPPLYSPHLSPPSAGATYSEYGLSSVGLGLGGIKSPPLVPTQSPMLGVNPQFSASSSTFSPTSPSTSSISNYAYTPSLSMTHSLSSQSSLSEFPTPMSISTSTVSPVILYPNSPPPPSGAGPSIPTPYPHQHPSPKPAPVAPPPPVPAPAPTTTTSGGRVYIHPPGHHAQGHAYSASTGTARSAPAVAHAHAAHDPYRDAVGAAVREESRKGSELGLSLGDFDMLETLGTGTFGRVILARLRVSPSRPAQTQPHYFAMKVLEKTTVVRLRQVEHLNSERRTLAQVGGGAQGGSGFLVNLLCTFQDERNLYLLLEYVQGGELFSHLRRAGRFSADVARFYAANLVLALEYLHERDVIYRDLKPENLLVDGLGYLKITDFGFAKHVTDRTYTLCGTPEYLAPEIITATGHGKAADYWALGVLLFELLAGYPPFFADNPLEIYEKILKGKFAFPPHIDYVAKDLIKRLLTADLSKRLGNLRGGARDVKNHRWFEGVDWEAVERKVIRAPIVPSTTIPGDTSNFEQYPSSPVETLPGVMRAVHARQMGVNPDSLDKGPDPYGYLFPHF